MLASVSGARFQANSGTSVPLSTASASVGRKGAPAGIDRTRGKRSAVTILAALPAAQTLQVDIEGEIDLGVLASLSGVKRAHKSGDRVTLAMDDLTRDGCAVLQALAAAGCKVRHISSDRGNLEDVFLTLTGRQLRD